MIKKEVNWLYLYKYMSFEQFVSMVELRRLYLTKVSIWDDTYETIPIKKASKEVLDRINEDHPALHFKATENLKNLFIDSYYAQSWTSTDEESDAMWRIYSSGASGVRIKFDEKIIATSIKKELSDKYPKSKKSLESFDMNYQKYVICYKDKRSAFQHELEYRFSVFIDSLDMVLNRPIDLYEDEKPLEYPSVIYYAISIGKLEEVLLDPRAPKYYEEMFMRYCVNRKFKAGIFSKSKLYTL